LRKKTIEEYLEIIYILQERYGYAQTGEIAKLMKIKAPSVSEMLIKLESEKLIHYEPYKGAILTEKGLKIAKELIKKHETISDFLITIGVKKEIANIDACRLEHHISNDSMDKLIKFLEFIKSKPFKPLWLEKFEEYLKTGKQPKCRFCHHKSNEPNKTN